MFTGSPRPAQQLQALPAGFFMERNMATLLRRGSRGAAMRDLQAQINEAGAPSAPSRGWSDIGVMGSNPIARSPRFLIKPRIKFVAADPVTREELIERHDLALDCREQEGFVPVLIPFSGASNVHELAPFTPVPRARGKAVLACANSTPLLTFDYPLRSKAEVTNAPSF